MSTEQKKNSLLQVKQLRKRYADANTEDINIINGIDLYVEENEFVCILGPSGCGKTTFLRCIAGFEHYEGEIKINGTVVTEPNTDRIMVFQDFNQLFPWKTVEQNVQYPLKLKGLKDKNKLREISDAYPDKVELKQYRNFYPHQLSGGMKQRVAIAKALALKPQIILMDEPFASLDAMTRKNLQKELLRIKEKENMTVIFITHNIQESIVLGTRILVMSKDGMIKMDETNEIEKPVTPASVGYGELWNKFNNALEEENQRTLQ